MNLDVFAEVQQKQFTFDEKYCSQNDIDVFHDDLINLEEKIRLKQNLLKLKPYEKQMLKLIYLYNRNPDPKFKLTLNNYRDENNQESEDEELVHYATDQNCENLRTVIKFINEQRLYLTQNLRKFTIEEKKRQRILANKAGIRQIQKPNG